MKYFSNLALIVGVLFGVNENAKAEFCTHNADYYVNLWLDAEKDIVSADAFLGIYTERFEFVGTLEDNWLQDGMKISMDIIEGDAYLKARLSGFSVITETEVTAMRFPQASFTINYIDGTSEVVPFQNIEVINDFNNSKSDFSVVNYTPSGLKEALEEYNGDFYIQDNSAFRVLEKSSCTP